MDTEITIFVLAGVIFVLVAVAVLVTTFRRSRRAKRHYAWAKRRQLINQAAVWHGYQPRPALSSHNDHVHITRPLRMSDLTEPIPKALHAQYRQAGEERARARKYYENE